MWLQNANKPYRSPKYIFFAVTAKNTLPVVFGFQWNRIDHHKNHILFTVYNCIVSLSHINCVTRSKIMWCYLCGQSYPIKVLYVVACVQRTDPVLTHNNRYPHHTQSHSFFQPASHHMHTRKICLILINLYVASLSHLTLCINVFVCVFVVDSLEHFWLRGGMWAYQYNYIAYSYSRICRSHAKKKCDNDFLEHQTPQRDLF